MGKFDKPDYPTEARLELKVGALVVMLENKAPWVNGTMGVVDFLDANLVRVKINDVVHTINKRKWEKKEYYYDPETQKLEQKVVASFEQYPVKLAWALTIHKAQGQTYSAVAIDMGDDGAFAAGQAYVALSRCKSMKMLYLLRPIMPNDIKVDQNVIEFMQVFNSGAEVV
jgi:ATP-dependent exoDNAse (exonuclease V) alpha subunit